MTAEKVRRAFCLTLPFCLTMAEKVRQVAKVRQYSCLTFYACSTPINKGDGEIVRQLGRLGKTFQNLALEGWGSRSLPNLPNRLTIHPPIGSSSDAGQCDNGTVNQTRR